MLNFRILNKLHFAVAKIKRAENNKNVNSHILKSDQNVVIKKIQLVFQKIDMVYKSKRLRVLGISFMEINMVRIKSIGSDKSSSIVSPYRGYIKNDTS